MQSSFPESQMAAPTSVTSIPCLDCNHKREAVATNVCSKCSNTLCDKCWKKAGNALMWGNMIFGWGAMLLSSGKSRYKCKACRRFDDLWAIGLLVVLVGGLFLFKWYMDSGA